MLKKVQALGLQLADLVTADEAAWAGKPEELVLLDLLLLQLLDVDHDQEVSLEELKAFQVGRLGGPPTRLGGMLWAPQRVSQETS